MTLFLLFAAGLLVLVCVIWWPRDAPKPRVLQATTVVHRLPQSTEWLHLVRTSAINEAEEVSLYQIDTGAPFGVMCLLYRNRVTQATSFVCPPQ